MRISRKFILPFLLVLAVALLSTVPVWAQFTDGSPWPAADASGGDAGLFI